MIFLHLFVLPSVVQPLLLCSTCQQVATVLAAAEALAPASFEFSNPVGKSKSTCPIA
jgi:hypothetical protein